MKKQILMAALCSLGAVAFAGPALADTMETSCRVPAYKTPGDPTSGIDHWYTTNVTATVLAPTSKMTWTAGWYVVTNKVAVEGTDNNTGMAICQGAVHLILADGCDLALNTSYESPAAIYVSNADPSNPVNSLTIYGQEENTGKLTTSSRFGAAIGGSHSGGDNITINGGIVTATSFSKGAGIGGAAVFMESGYNGSYITINGGIVNANAVNGGAGIGGGNKGGHGFHITINGGTVNANASYGSSGDGSAIGGGWQGTGQSIVINGGSITACGGSIAGSSAIGNGANASIAAADIRMPIDMVLKAGASANPRARIAHDSTTDLAPLLAGKRFATAEMFEIVPIPSAPVEVENATALVYTNGVLSTSGTVLTNLSAYVVYRAHKGYTFDEGITVITNELDTTLSPSVNDQDETVPMAHLPSVKLGTVAQRYPWYNMLDIEYKTLYPNEYFQIVFKANETELAKTPCQSGVQTLVIDLDDAAGGVFKNKRLKDVKITTALEEVRED